MTITIGVTEWTLDKRGVDALPRARELGFDAIQIRLYSLDTLKALENDAVRTEFLAANDAHNMPIVGMSAGLFGQIPLHDATQEDYVVELWERIITVALGLNIQVVYCPSFGVSKMTTPAEIAQTATVFRRACEIVDERPLFLATENSLDAADHRALVEQVNHPKMRVLLDAYNPVNFGYNTADLVRDLSNINCNQFHAKDDTPDGNALLGEGNGLLRNSAQDLAAT